MIRNYLTIALRNAWRHKAYTFINILGLAIGIASSIIILLFVLDELSYDRHNEKFDQIFRINIRGKIQGSQVEAALSNAPMGPTLKADFPEVLEYTRLYTFEGDPVVRYGENVFVEENFYYADSTFFRVFTAPVVRGDPNGLLNRPNTVVLTEETAKKYFGEEDPVGKMLLVGQDEEPYEVTGVVKGFPENSHFHFNILGSMTSVWVATHPYWLGNNNYTYIVLQKGYPPEELEAKFPALLEKHMGPQLEELLGMTLEEFHDAGNQYGYFLKPLRDIHLRSDLQFEIEPGGSMTSVIIFSIIAVFLIIIASINFMNLATASATRRATEVGIRKVAGANRNKLIWQFITESFLITVFALIFSVVLVELFLPAFNHLANKELKFSFIGYPLILAGLVLIGIFVGFASGSYPAFFLSSFKPAEVLKSSSARGSRGAYLRRVLVTFQFVITITLFISTIVVNRQMNFIQRKDLGFDKKNLVVISRAYVLGNQAESFRQELLKNPQIVAVSGSNSVPGGLIGDNAYLPEGANTEELYSINDIHADPRFARTYSLELKEGRWFDENIPTDSFAVVLNEAAVKALGFSSPLDHRLLASFDEDAGPMPVIGVVKNFNFQSLHQEIKPLVIQYLRFRPTLYTIRIKGDQTREALHFIENTWNSFVENQPIQMSFLDDDLSKLYNNDEKIASVFSIFAILAIFIAALGLLGLASYSATQRTKEVGIRKAMGASISSVLVTLSREFAWLVLYATLIAWPVGYFVMKGWLQGYPDRVNLSPVIFLLSTLLALVIAAVTVLIRVYQAASVNPVRSLRYE